jgi:hypothetical protein
MAKVSEIQRAIAEFERQRDVLQACIDALNAQRAQWNPKKLHAAKTVRHRLDAGKVVTGSVQAITKESAS